MNENESSTATPLKPSVPRRFKDISGTKIGIFTVIKDGGKNRRGKWTWQCKCQCQRGGVFLLCEESLMNWRAHHCICLNLSCTKKANTSHGLAHAPINAVWSTLIQRCMNPKNKRWEDYGGRGITVCDRWRNFELFYEDMGPSYRHGLQIERRDNNRGYCPENCEWVTPKQQANNTRKNRFVEWEGKRFTVTQLAESVNLRPMTLWQRLSKRGWGAVTKRDLLLPHVRRVVA